MKERLKWLSHILRIKDKLPYIARFGILSKTKRQAGSFPMGNEEVMKKK